MGTKTDTQVNGREEILSNVLPINGFENEVILPLEEKACISFP